MDFRYWSGLGKLMILNKVVAIHSANQIVCKHANAKTPGSYVIRFLRDSYINMHKLNVILESKCFIS